MLQGELEGKGQTREIVPLEGPMCHRVGREVRSPVVDDGRRLPTLHLSTSGDPVDDQFTTSPVT